MEIKPNNYSISELLDMIERRELVVNPDYQRGTGIWPVGARSYFIDTILSEYPFPKIYIYEYMARGKSIVRKKEIVDGQQRINTIVDFRQDKFAITGESTHSGKKFSDLSEDEQVRFLSYSVPVEVIRNATKGNILQMFRRMNAYTLPLNEAEKRHSGFQGQFKWFVNEVADACNDFFVEYGVFTNRQIVRMADAELIAEVVLATERGIISTSPKDLRSIYHKYDDNFPGRTRRMKEILGAVDFIASNLTELRGTYLMKPYAVQTLLIALIFNRFGVSALAEQFNVEPIEKYASDNKRSESRLVALAQAHEAMETDDTFGLYVWGAAGGTNRAPRRTARFLAVMKALGNPVRNVKDRNLAGGIPF